MTEVLYVPEAERQYVDPDLDLEYVERVGGEIAATLHHAGVAEAAYQPGDGTFYGLVFVPLRIVETAGARVKDGQTWDSRACRGMLASDGTAELRGLGGNGAIEAINALPYDRRGYLVARVEGQSYPIRLGGRRRDLAADYVAEHWGLPATSAVSVALLLRGVSHHLDLLDAA